MTFSKEIITEKLTEVIDPEVGLNIIDMGLVYDIEIRDSDIFVQMTLTTPGCPMSSYLTGATRSALAALDGVGEVDVELVWEPPWSPERINLEALERLRSGDY